MESGSAGSSSDPLSLSQLISRAFALASSPASASSEEPTSLALTLLARADDLSQTLGVISPNEPLKDISTPSLRVLLIPSLRGELETRVRTATPHERKARLESSKVSGRFAKAHSPGQRFDERRGHGFSKALLFSKPCKPKHLGRGFRRMCWPPY